MQNFDNQWFLLISMFVVRVSAFSWFCVKILDNFTHFFSLIQFYLIVINRSKLFIVTCTVCSTKYTIKSNVGPCKHFLIYLFYHKWIASIPKVNENVWNVRKKGRVDEWIWLFFCWFFFFLAILIFYMPFSWLACKISKSF